MRRATCAVERSIVTRITLPHREGCGGGPLAPASRAVASAKAEGADSSHLVSDRRLQEFLEAEVSHFASMPRTSLTLGNLLGVTASPRQSALQVHTEIPKHFAARIRQIEQVPSWKHNGNLCEVHRIYSKSFSELRMIEADAYLSEFTEVILKLKERQRKVLPLIGQVRDRLHDSVGENEHEFWEKWFTTFLRSRISTEMLTSQYLAITEQMQQGLTTITGIVDPACDPAAICRGAAKAARHLCLSRIGIEPEVHIEVRSKVSTSFSYVGRYLHYILVELLKSRCEATAQSALLSSIADPVPAKPIHVVICSDNHRVAIRVRDLSGGVPFDLQHRVWDFLCPGYYTDHMYEVTNLWMPDTGYGMGLPQMRLLVEYLGGQVTLKSLPDYGDDFYMFLPRIDISRILAGAAVEDEATTPL